MLDDFAEVPSLEPYVGDVLAIRMFCIDPDSQTLGGLTYHQEVGPGVNVAQCPLDNEDGHVAPHPGCSCGWYAYDEDRHWPTLPMENPVPAIVRASGRVVICERGLKAEYIEVIAVVTDAITAPLVAKILPDVETFADEESMLKAHPLHTLSRMEEEFDEPSDGGRKAVARAVAAPVNTVTWVRAKMHNAWRAISASTAFRDVFGRLLEQIIRLAVCGTALWGLMLASRAVFPPASLEGFGSLVPFGALLVLSPILNLWRTPTGLLAYIMLLSYGVAGSAESLGGLLTASSVTDEQWIVVLLAVYLVPVLLLSGHIIKALIGPTPSRAGAVHYGSTVATGAVRGSNMTIIGSGRGKTMSVPVKREYLPKKIKSVPSGYGDSDPGTTEEGGHNG